MTRRLSFLFVCAVVCLVSGDSSALAAQPSFAQVVEQVQPKIVKIYGAGGLKGLEAYQSGFLISGEGHVLTVYSYVLDTEEIGVVLNDGQKFQAKLLGADPTLEIAVLKIDGAELPHFDLAEAKPAQGGTRILTFSNLFGVATGNEPASVLHGSVAVKTPLNARRGTFETPYRGPVYVLDAITNNPGAAGGATTDRKGRLIGMLGKELRNSLNNTWLNYALPISELSQSVTDIRAGKYIPRRTEDDLKASRPMRLSSLGIVLVPDVLQRTPPFIDVVRKNTPASRAGLLPDDLIVFIDGRLTQSVKNVRSEMQFIEDNSTVKISILRNQELLEFSLQPDQIEN